MEFLLVLFQFIHHLNISEILKIFSAILSVMIWVLFLLNDIHVYRNIPLRALFDPGLVFVMICMNTYVMMDVAGVLCMPHVKVNVKHVKTKASSKAIKHFTIGTANILLLFLFLISRDYKFFMFGDVCSCIAFGILLLKYMVWFLGYVIAGFKYPLIDVFRKKFMSDS